MFAKLAILSLSLLSGGTVTQWLPDLIVDAVTFADRSQDAITLPNRVLLRFRSSIPNIGLGEFRIIATGVGTGDGVHQTLEQQIQYSDGSTELIPLDSDFLYNTLTLKMDVTWWTRYHIREVLPGDGVGPILAHGAKPEINVTSSTSYDLGLPNAPAPGTQLSGFGPVQGISVGYTDIYPKGLPEQWVDVSHLPPGEYWLEMQVDVSNKILESDDTNNTARAKITLNHANLPAFRTHMADTDINLMFSLSELLRVIQLFNSQGFHCLANTDDGYLPGTGDDYNCLPHSSDYNPQDWIVNLSELLRLIQLFNLGIYISCPDSEDGYCPL